MKRLRFIEQVFLSVGLLTAGSLTTPAANVQLLRPGKVTEQRDTLLRLHGIASTPEALAKGLQHPNAMVCALCISRLSTVGTDEQIEAVKEFILREPPEHWTGSLEFQALGALNEMCRRASREKAQVVRPFLIQRANRQYESATELADRLRCSDLLATVGGPVRVEPVLEALETAAQWEQGKVGKRGIHRTPKDLVSGGLRIAGVLLLQGRETAPFARLVSPLERLMRDTTLDPGLRRKAAMLLAYVPDPAAEKSLRSMAESEEEGFKAEARKWLDQRDQMLKPLTEWRASGAPRDTWLIQSSGTAS